MKKTILKSLLLGAAALTALTASAASVQVIMDDIEVTPGGSFVMANVYVQHDNYFSAIEFHFGLIPGITFMAAAPADAEMVEPNQPWPMGGIPEVLETPIKWSPSYNTDNTNNEFKVVCKFDENNLDGVVAYFPPGRTLCFRIAVKAADDFTGAKLHLNYLKTDYSDPGAPTFVGIAELNDVDVCDIKIPTAATPLATIVAEGVDGTEYTVADALTVVAKTDQYLFVTDGKDNASWMKVAAPSSVIDQVDIDNNHIGINAGALTGTLSDFALNQMLTMKEGTTLTIVDAAKITPVLWSLAQTNPNDPQYIFAPKVNEVINLKGYWNAEKKWLQGFSTGGQNVAVDLSWCASEPTLVDGTVYNVECVAQLKGASKADLPADNCEKYVVYPTSVENIDVVTGVENLNGDKSVVSVQYVNVAGQISNTPFQGVNMVVTRYADGSTVTTKVIK